MSRVEAATVCVAREKVFASRSMERRWHLTQHTSYALLRLIDVEKVID